MNNREPDLPMSDVSTAYREAMHDTLREEPSHAIDDAIRAAARRAVSAGPQSVKKSWFARHTTPMAVAASVLLTGSLLLVANREQPGVLTQPMESPVSVASSKPPLAPAEPLAPAAPPLARAEMAKVRERQTVSPTPVLRQDRVANASALPAMVPPPAPAMPVPPPAPSARSLVPASAEAVSDRLAGMAAAPAPPSAPAAAPAPAPESAPAAAPVVPTAAASAKTALPSQGANRVRGFSDSAGQLSVESKKAETAESIESWITRLSALQTEGKTAQLHEELRKLRKAHPSSELPKTLQDEWLRISP